MAQLAQRKYQRRRSAQGFGSGQVQVSDANVSNVKAAGAERVKHLTNLAVNDYNNKMKWLSDQQKAQGQTEQARATARSLDRHHSKLVLASKHQKGKMEVQKAAVKKQNEEQRWQDIMTFMKGAVAAASTLKALNDKHKAKQEELGKQDAIHRAATQSSLAAEAAAARSKTGSTSDAAAVTAAVTEQKLAVIRADTEIDAMEATGVYNPKVITKLRNGVRLTARDIGDFRQSSLIAGKSWTSDIEELRLTRGNEISYYSERLGKEITLDTTDSTELAEILTSPAVWQPFLEKHGLTQDILEKNSEIIPEFWSSIQEQNSVIVGKQDKAEIKALNTKFTNEAINAWRNNPSLETLLESIEILSRTRGEDGTPIGDLGAMMLLSEDMETRRSADGFSLHYTDEHYEVLWDNPSLTDPNPKMKGQKMKDRSPTNQARYQEGIQKRRKLQGQLAEEGRKFNKQEDQKIKQAVIGYFSANPQLVNDEHLEPLIEKYKLEGKTETVKALNKLRHDRNYDDKYYKNKFDAALLVGGLRVEMVNEAAISPGMKLTYVEKAKKNSGTGMSKDDKKKLERFTKDTLSTRVKHYGLSVSGQTTDPSFAKAHEAAQLRGQQAYTTCMLGTGVDCYDHAETAFQKEFDKGPHAGDFAILDTTTTAEGVQIAGTSFKNYQVDMSLETKEHPLSKIREAIKLDPLAIDKEELISKSKLENAVAAQKNGSGLLLRLVPEAQKIADMYGPNSGVSALDIVNRQLVFHGLEPFETEFGKQNEMTSDPEYWYLLNYKPNGRRELIWKTVGQGTNVIRDPANYAPNLRAVYNETQGGGYTVEGVTDREGDRVVLNKETWTGLNKIKYIAGGAISVKDITESQLAISTDVPVNLDSDSKPINTDQFTAEGGYTVEMVDEAEAVIGQQLGNTVEIVGDTLQWFTNNPDILKAQGWEHVSTSNGKGLFRFIGGTN